MNFEELLNAATKLSIKREFIEIWIPRAKFVEAIFDVNSLSITRIDNPFFGFGFGPRPYIDPKWSSFTITRNTPKEFTSKFKLVGQWDAYGIQTTNFEIAYQRLENHSDINKLIEVNAPELSIRAGDDEVVTWVGIDGVALGAICQWESGGYVLSAIVVDQNFRGKGLGKQITKALITEAHKQGINYVALGVMAKNQPAIATYQKVGFEELGKFNTFQFV